MSRGWMERAGWWASNRILAQGRIPRHVAVIMDGNRRYAQQHGLPVMAGHEQGYNRLLDALEWLLELGVEEISTFTFSIANFGRPPAQVDDLMQLACAKVRDLMGRRDLIDKYRLYVRFVGDLSLLPLPVQTVFAEAMQATEMYRQPRGVQGDGTLLNICFSYSCQYDLCATGRTLAVSAAGGAAAAKGISVADFCRAMLVAHPPNLIIRTSGEQRLSDFMTFQGAASKAVVVFLQVLWPELSAWDLFRAILHYQRWALPGPPLGAPVADLTRTLASLDDQEAAFVAARLRPLE